MRTLEKADRLLANMASFVLAPKWFPVLLAAYLAALYVARISLFPGASDDDAEVLFYAQKLALGYKPTQPPLYNWMVLGAESVLGVGIAAAEAVKFICLFAMYLFLWASGRIVLEDGRLAVLAALSVVGFFYVGWDAIMNYSHTVLVAVAVAATLFTALRLERRHGLADYAWLGAAIGTGFLAKYNYGLFLGPFVVAAMLDPVLRPRLLDRRMLLAIAVAAAMSVPHLVWLANNSEGMRNLTAWAPVGAGATLVAGLSSAALAPISFLSPWLILAAILLPRAFLPLRTTGSASDAIRRMRLFAVTFAGIMAVAVALVVAFDVTKVRTHWMMVLVWVPLWVLLRARTGAADARGFNRLAGVLAVGALVLLVAVGIRAATGTLVCRKCNFFVPYAALAEQLRAEGFTGGVLVAADHPNQLAGNFRRFFPESRFYSTRYPRFALGEPDVAGGACLAIWNTARETGEREAMDLAAHRVGAVPAPGYADAHFIEAPIRFSGERKIRLGFRLLECR